MVSIAYSLKVEIYFWKVKGLTVTYVAVKGFILNIVSIKILKLHSKNF